VTAQPLTTPRLRASPGLKAGRGLKLAVFRHARGYTTASPGLKAGRGLKHASGLL